MDPGGGRRPATEPVDHLPVALDHLNSRRWSGGRLRHLDHPFEEEAKPSLPSSLGADPLQVVVVVLAVLLQVEAQIEERALQTPSATSSRVIRSRPTRPLPSRKGWIDSNWAWASAALIRIGSARLVVQESLECRHRGLDLLPRWRHIARERGPRAADPVLLAAEAPRRPLDPRPEPSSTACTSRKRRLQSGSPSSLISSRPAIHRADVVGRLPRVGDRHPGSCVGLEEQESESEDWVPSDPERRGPPPCGRRNRGTDRDRAAGA